MSWAKIKLLVLDFDGVITNDKVYVDENGKETVCCSRSDSFGIEMIKKVGIDVLVLSKEKNRVVQARCKKLAIKSIQGLNNKLIALKREIEKRRLTKQNVCYVGNDVSDLECMKLAGLCCTVKDAHPRVKKVTRFITNKKGGNGAIREICDKLIKAYEK